MPVEEPTKPTTREEFDHEAALIERLAKAEISEEAFNRAMRYLERKNELEGMR